MKPPPLLPWWLVVATIAAFAAAMCVSGCATESELAAANATESPNLPPLHVRVEDPHAVCLSRGAKAREGRRINACAEWRGIAAPGYCLVILPQDAPRWLIQHEELHCKYGRWHD